MRTFLLMLLWLLLAGVNAASVFASQRPNIVIMVADDLGYADPGFRGSKIDTPTIDQLARSGMVLERFYTAPLCTPTRAALLTGRDPMRLGLAYNVLLPWDNGGIHTAERLMSESFQQAGYQTAMIGKWHLGHAQHQFTPLARGFDEFYGHLHTEVGFYPPFSAAGGKDFQHNGVSIEDEGYESYLLADHASNWIKNRDHNKPFFLYLPFLAPHEPLQAPESLVKKYAEFEDNREPPRSPSGGQDAITKLAQLVAPSRRPIYAAVVEAMDAAMGRVINTLEAEGIGENTIILFFSDNGATRMSGRGGGDNAPLRGGKAEVYEGGIRVVSMVNWPAKIKAGVSNEMITVMDMFPTLAAAANVEPDNHYPLDGLNMLPILLGDTHNAPERKESVFFASEIPTYGSFNFTAIKGDWKLVQWVEQDLTSTSVKNELYNLADDLSEYNNLAQTFPERVHAMSKEILQWRSLHPINGTRARLAAPTGWRAPLDWVNFPRGLDGLQDEPLGSIAPTKMSEQILDMRLKNRGRLIYNCQPSKWMAGYCFEQKGATNSKAKKGSNQ